MPLVQKIFLKDFSRIFFFEIFFIFLKFFENFFQFFFF